MMKPHLRQPLFFDRTCFALVCLFSVLALAPFLLLLFELFKNGIRHFNPPFFVDMAPDSIEAMLAQLENQPVSGGIASGIYGSLLILPVAAGAAIPTGILAGIYIHENRTRRLSLLAQYACAILKGAPAVVIGFVVYLWTSFFFVHSPVWAGSLSLAVFLLPSIVCSTQRALDSLPEYVKESGFALGGSYTNVWFKIILPSVRKKLLSGILTSLMQTAGITAPLILVVLSSSATNMDGNGDAITLSLLIWRFFNHPNMTGLMWATSLFLFLIVAALYFANKYVLKSMNHSESVSL
ncbi:MAG: ABC transporter permease subunit [Dysgonamonadaceae bacterium]|jgi:phosphate transport system permease protein|nr:ABC transporter permease subunit [Dysgonamonadaceae bacterium]